MKKEEDEKGMKTITRKHMHVYEKKNSSFICLFKYNYLNME